jgi:two-component system LytT family response regulator/two-component system response regulator LytT
MKIRCLIVDDEPPARDELAYLLSFYDDIEIVDSVDSASKAISSIIEIKPDLVFLDIQMPGKNGFDVLSELQTSDHTPLFIFATAYDQYAIKAFEENAIDYLLKPFSKDRITKSLERVRKILQKGSDKNIQNEVLSLLETMGKKKVLTKISVESKGRIILLNPEDIVFFQYESKKINVHTTSEIYTLYSISTMDKLERHLEGEPFFRCHRVTLININHIKEFSTWFNGKYNLKMGDKAGSELIVSRSRAKDFKLRLGL